jgi:hypothetical protein
MLLEEFEVCATLVNNVLLQNVCDFSIVIFLHMHCACGEWRSILKQRFQVAAFMNEGLSVITFMNKISALTAFILATFIVCI